VTVDDRPVLVLDFGAQYAQLIARRVREAGRYSEIVPGTTPASQLRALNPAALVLSGGPASVYEPGAPQLDPAAVRLGIPVFGICYGFQAMAQALGGRVERTGGREYGAAELAASGEPSALLADLPDSQRVWMSHGDAVTSAPSGMTVVGSTAGAPIAAFEDAGRGLAGVQFHPEVGHTTHGQDMIARFLRDIAGLEPNWSTEGIIEAQVAAIAEQVGDGHAICGLSGGVDSAVAAALVHRAIGDRLTCVFVDHGLLRAGEREQVERDYVAATGIRLVTVDAADRFLSALAGVSDPEAKRKIIGREFIRVFESAERDIVASGADHGEAVEFLVQGTLYPDVVESGGGSGTANIKSHHNVGGLPDDLQFQLVEPLRALFKDEVRQVGQQLGLPAEMVWRHPFPGPGLAIRIVGAVDADRLAVLRAADLIVREEITAAGLDRSIWQLPVVLLADVRSVGVQGDGRTYGHPVVLRPVTSEDAMTADWARLPYEVLERVSTRITNEVPEVNRVVLDITSKPPGTIEWE
jgi:GMP synthase (glutamine-hydrolysing)